MKNSFIIKLKLVEFLFPNNYHASVKNHIGEKQNWVHTIKGISNGRINSYPAYMWIKD